MQIEYQHVIKQRKIQRKKYRKQEHLVLNIIILPKKNKNDKSSQQEDWSM